MLVEDPTAKISENKLSAGEIYDLYAPAVYGKIVSIVHQEPIAGKICEKVFIKLLQDKNVLNNPLKSPLISLLNESREKSYKTIKALNLFTQCCGGSSVLIPDKK